MQIDIRHDLSPVHTTVVAQGPHHIGAISRDLILSELSTRGAVLFRGFDCDVEAFSQLVEDSSTRTSIDPAREFFAKNVQLVDAGLDAVGLHCENGNSPMQPDIVWFYCARAAKRGSQTTLCDGFSVWDDLRPETKALFADRQLTYSRTVPEHLWKKFVRHHVPSLEHEEITEARLTELFAHIKGVAIRLKDDGSLELHASLPPAHPTRFSSRIAFANSLLGPSYNYERPRIRFEDGEDVPAWAMDDILTVTEKHTFGIDWADGDVIAIDNTRFMHGRHAILDTDRKLFTALSYV